MSWFSLVSEQLYFSIFVTPTDFKAAQSTTHACIVAQSCSKTCFNFNTWSNTFKKIKDMHIPKQSTGICILRTSQLRCRFWLAHFACTSGFEDQEHDFTSPRSRTSSLALPSLSHFWISSPRNVFFTAVQLASPMYNKQVFTFYFTATFN